MARRRKIYKVSKMEREILVLLESRGYKVMTQFKIAGVPYIYDFMFPDSRKILEVQGDYWHANPTIYKSGSLIRMVGFKEKILVDYIWQRDELKARMAQQHGFHIYYLLERDYKAHGWAAIEECLYN